MYARGILFGKMKYELGDHSVVRCPENNLVADVEFKTKGYFGGTYNAIGGAIRNEKTGEVLFELSGMWSGEMFLKNVMTGHKELLFNATHAKHTPPLVRPLEEQNERESQKLWHKTVVAIKERNHDAATDEKTRIEDMQREEAGKRAEDGVEWHPRLFRRVRGGPGGPEEGEEDLDWILNADIDGPTPEAKIHQIMAIAPIIQGQYPSQKYDIPSQHNDQSQPQLQQRQPQPQQTQLPLEQAPPQFQQSQPQLQQTPPQTQQAPPPAHDANQSDLIDFGQLSVNEAAPAQAPMQQQQMAAHNAPPGLQEPLTPAMGPPIVRLDTNTEEIDVFVDAADRKP
ncbi:MAG: hypothetical protein M1830_005692 [Pleopsidium flavum]|nr:MAG: hypothetical protein M1830_005692 [Pleopsidium flavum]